MLDNDAALAARSKGNSRDDLGDRTVDAIAARAGTRGFIGDAERLHPQFLSDRRIVIG